MELQEGFESRAGAAHARLHSSALTYPEGGLEAWLTVFGSFSALFMVFGMVNSTAVLQEHLLANQLRYYSPTSVSWVFSINLFLTFFCGIWSGKLFDAKGPRWLVGFGSIASVCSLIFLAFCTGIWPSVFLTPATLARIADCD